MDANTLSPIQKYELDIMKEILKIFDQENIRYYMQGGTMLGAVRHKGFIPWDDDIDIGVLRPDYDRFIKICEKYLPEHLKLRTYWDESYYHYYFSRIVDTRYHIKREGGLEERLEELWIDIFPLDAMPRNRVVYTIHKWHLICYRFLYSVSCFNKINIRRPGRPFLHRIIIKFILTTRINKLFACIDSNKVLDKIDRILKKYKIDNNDEIINFMGDNHIRGYSKACYGYGIEQKYRFEDIELVGIKDYDYYLNVLYGDYMKLPPKEKRDIHIAKLVEKE